MSSLKFLKGLSMNRIRYKSKEFTLNDFKNLGTWVILNITSIAVRTTNSKATGKPTTCYDIFGKLEDSSNITEDLRGSEFTMTLNNHVYKWLDKAINRAKRNVLEGKRAADSSLSLRVNTTFRHFSGKTVESLNFSELEGGSNVAS